MTTFKIINKNTLDKYRKEISIETSKPLSKGDISIIHFKDIINLSDLNDYFGRFIFSIVSYKPSKLQSNGKYITSWKYNYNCD